MNRAFAVVSLFSVLIIYFGNTVAEPLVVTELAEQENGIRIVAFYNDSLTFQLKDQNGAYIGNRYSYIGTFQDGYAIFQDGFFFGVMDQTGCVVIEPIYDRITYMSDGIFCVEKDNGFILIDAKKNIIASVGNGTVDKCFDNYVVFEQSDTYKNGIISVDGTMISEPVWDELDIISCGIFKATDIGAHTANYYIDASTGETIFQCDEGLRFSEGFCIVTKNGTENIIDIKGNIVYTAAPDELIWGHFSCGLCYFRDRNTRKFGYINPMGEWLVSPIYEWAREFDDGYGIGQRDGMYVLINSDGQETIGIKADNVSLGHDGYLTLEKNGLYAAINANGEMVTPYIWDGMGLYSEGFFAVEKDGLWGFINDSGHLSVECQFLKVGRFADGRVIVEDKNHDQWIMDHKGSIIAPAH